MITLSKSGSSVTFTFDENSGYLQNGTIEVPVNSLSLVIDDSDMATFRKSASNDIFVSARYEDFGMTKAELESWYKDNMVGETGGGGGVDSGTVQTMIDESISGKADTTAVTEAISEAVSGKVDVSIYTAYTAATDERIAEDEEVTAAGINAINDAFTAYTASTDAVLSGKADTSAVTQSIAEATSGKADTTAVTASINAAVSGKVDTSVYTAYTAATDARFAEDELASGEAFNDLNNRVNELSGNAISSGEVQTLIDESVSGKVDTSVYTAYTAATDAVLSGKVNTSVYTAYTAATDARILEDEEVTAAGLNSINETFTAYTAATDAVLSGKVNTTTYTAYTAATDTLIGGKASQSDLNTVSGAVANKQDTLVSGTNIKTINNQSLLGSGNIDIQGGGGSGNPTVELTQAEYDALVTAGTVSADTYYIITDATPIDINNYVATSAITSAVTSASTDSEIPTAKAVYDAVGQGGGGGKAIEAGIGIAITTGATADTVSLDVPISAGTGSNSIICGKNNNKASGSYSFAGGEASSATSFWSFTYGAGCKSEYGAWSGGYQCKANGSYSFAIGERTKTSYDSECSIGHYNVTNTGSTTSAQTLFSVGNGTADNARHNAFEIRKNADIYVSNGTSDVKLQDYLQIKAVKVTQAEYDALVQGGTVDANTLYIITNVVS